MPRTSCATCTRPVFKPGVYRLCIGCRTFPVETVLTTIPNRNEAGATWIKFSEMFPERTFRLCWNGSRKGFDLFVKATP